MLTETSQGEVLGPQFVRSVSSRAVPRPTVRFRPVRAMLDLPCNINLLATFGARPLACPPALHSSLRVQPGPLLRAHSSSDSGMNLGKGEERLVRD